MGLLRLIRLQKHVLGLVVVPLLALALAGPAGAETKTKPQNPPTGGTPSAQAKSTTPAPKLKLDTDVAPPATGQGAAKPEATTAQPGTDQVKPTPEGDAAAAGSNPAGSQILVNIDKSTQEMTVFVDGIEQYTWKVSTGRPEYATPSGTYTPTSMNEMWYSKQWDNSPMPHAIFFMKDGHAIHGTHEVKNLGKAASHGCVRISPENAAILYDLVEKNGMQNTQVVLSGETPGGEYKGVATAKPQYPYQQYPYGRGQAVAPPWFNPGQEAQVQPDQQPQPRRRGLFGRWFQQNQGYYAPPPPPRYYQRGYGY